MVHTIDILDIEKHNMRHRAVSLRQHGFLVAVCCRMSTRNITNVTSNMASVRHLEFKTVNFGQSFLSQSLSDSVY